MWDTISEEARVEIETGEAAIGTLRRYESYERWREIGKALHLLQIAAQGNLPKPIGRGYADRYQQLGKHVPKLVAIDKAARSHAIAIEKNAAKIDQWHIELDPVDRLRLNHPTAVYRAYMAYERGQLPTNIEKKPSSLEIANLKITDLQTENARLTAIAHKAWDKLSDTNVIAQITSTRKEDRIRRIATALLKHVGDKPTPVAKETKATRRQSRAKGNKSVEQKQDTAPS
jgi:hypothetical protein